MEIKLSNGDRLTIPQGCKATVNGSEIIIEKKHEFKDGDILTSIYDGNTTLIFKCYHNDGSGRGISYFNTETNSLKGIDNKCWDVDSFRQATDEEKQHLFDKMKERGLRWNKEEKRVEKIRWRAKKGDRYWTLSLSSYLDILESQEDNDAFDQGAWKCGNYFKTQEQADKLNRKKKNVWKTPKYAYPRHVTSSALLSKISSRTSLKIDKTDCASIGRLDSQVKHGKAIFGSGFLLSDKAAADKAAAEKAAAEKAIKWELSERERAIIRQLENNK